MAAFTEYVLRPLTDDLKQILEQLGKLGFAYDARAFMSVTHCLVLYHLGLEVFRNVVYLLMTSLICWTAWHILR